MKEFKNLYNEIIQSSFETLSNFPWENINCYTKWLAQTYYFTRHSTRLLALAAGYSPIYDDTTHFRFLEHLKEETGHENLALQDLKALKLSINEFEEMIETQSFYNLQYNMLKNYGPSAFLGWIVYLEGIASVFGPTAVNKCKHYHPSTTRFLRIHAEEDQRHIDSAFELIETTKVYKDKWFLQNFIDSSKIYCSIFDKISYNERKRDIAV